MTRVRRTLHAQTKYATDESYERSLEASRQAKLRRKRPCIRGCGRLVGYESTSRICQACRVEEAQASRRHGTVAMYERGRCRCDECRAGNTARHRALLERRAAS